MRNYEAVACDVNAAVFSKVQYPLTVGDGSIVTNYAGVHIFWPLTRQTKHFARSLQSLIVKETETLEEFNAKLRKAREVDDQYWNW